MVFVIIGMVISVIINSTHKYKYTKVEKDRIKTEISGNMDSLVSDDLTLDEVKDILGDDSALNIYITLGEGSYIRQKLTDKVIKKYNLEDLVKQQDYYISKVEELYKNNLQYKIVSEYVDGNDLCENIEIITWYYSLYVNDYIDIMTRLSNINVDDDASKTKESVEYYKNQIRALKVLDKHLDYYNNKDKEKEELQVCYRNGKLVDNNQMLTLTLALQGELYSNMDFSNNENVILRTERINGYLSELDE